MTRLPRTLGLLFLPLLLAACANATGATPDGGGTAGGGSDGSCGEEIVGDGPDASVGYTPCPGDQVPATPVASPVEPTPGMAGIRARGWDTADVAADGRHVTISFVSGIEPCAVLDHIDVAYGAKAVTVTLYEGHDPDAGDVACIDIGVFKKVTVDLTEPLGDRSVTDGVT
jgi:hypothetical protein